MVDYDDGDIVAKVVVKDIRIMFENALTPRSRFFGLPRKRTVFLMLTLAHRLSSTHDVSKWTTTTNVDNRGRVTYAEHIIFDVRCTGPLKISFKCTDPDGVGIAAIIGEGAIDLSDYGEIQHKFVSLLRIGDRSKIGQLSFNVFLLSPGPPNDLDKAIYNREIFGRHIGTLADKFRAHLEWIINKPAVHSTLNYYITSMGESEYAIPLELHVKPEIKLEIWALHRRWTAKTSVELTSQAIWQKLTIGQKFEVKEPLMENRNRRGMLSFTISCHGLLKFRDLCGSSPIPVTPKESPAELIPTPLSTSLPEIDNLISSGRSTSTRSNNSQITWSASNDISFNGILPDAFPQSSRIPGTLQFCRKGCPSLIDFTYPQSNRIPSALQSPQENVFELPPSNTIFRKRYLLKWRLDVLNSSHPLYLGEHLRTKDTFVVKIFSVQKAWIDETDLLVKLKGKHVVKLADADTDKKYDLYFTVTVNYGENLEKELQRLRSLRDTQSQRELFKNICQAVQFIHSEEIVHLNLEPSNILLKEDGSLKIRICGFSHARKVDSHIYRTDEVSNGYCITPGFGSPELVSTRGDIRATYAQDVFSLGCILYNIVSKMKLYESEEAFPRIPIEEYVGYNCHDQLVEDLLLKMLERDPNNRPTIEEVLRDAYFVGRPPSPVDEKRWMWLKNQPVT
ncbi:11720_t:CDS:2 [Paraglomus brasilianum]|uniref:11720_t:CDS:1 n=1 Tax=Paraglomus brasilianum TaxID=144538 RepID=A0A9N9G504_9GLOM|nr:11720_t:CDS:2 [Paraglomus brasilianum]